ncbi:MAG: polysaccharide biosynthesis protein [bacterium]
MIKRIFDIVFACVILIFFLPVVLIIVLLIKFDSRGPVFLKQESVGKDGKRFKVFQFRTVFTDTINGAPRYIRYGDPRLTRVGKILERLRVDHLPELINVLKGEMSLMGPTPEVPSIVKLYSPEESKVLSVRPGIFCPTNFFDINGWDQYPENLEEHQKYYIENVLHRKLAYERHYVDQVALRRDFKLIKDGLVSVVCRKLQDVLIKDIKTVSFILPHDIILVTMSYLLAYVLRFEWSIPKSELHTFQISVLVLVPLRILVFHYYRFYKKLWRYLGVGDLLTIVKACTVSSVLFAVIIFLLGFEEHSRSVLLIDWLLCISFVGSLRMVLRFFSENLRETSVQKTKVLIIGAGDVGEMLLRQLNKTSRDRYHVIGLIDDNPKKLGLEIHGVRVLGETSELVELVRLYKIDEVVIAISKISAEKMKKITRMCEYASIKYQIVPAVNDLLSGKFHLSKMRKVEISDLFGRQPVELDISGIREYLLGKRILVTGAGGSIGSELCRQIFEYSPNTMLLIDKNENYLHEIECELRAKPSTVNIVTRLMDITDKRNSFVSFKKHLPEVIFHAAAQKHVPLGERNPQEVIRHNVLGTKIVVDLADYFKAGHFIMVSTDKAVNPTSLMGASKRLAELYVQAMSKQSATKYFTVRFGNVLNSNGSVVPMFMKQIANGGPVTVTHPDIERYFMSIFEAVQLILQALTMGKSGEIFILDMGRSIKIFDLAKELIKYAGLRPNIDINIEFTGLRPGEKLFEELIGKGEDWVPTYHDSIKTLKSNYTYELNWIDSEIKKLVRISLREDVLLLKKKIQSIIAEYQPSDFCETVVDKEENNHDLKDKEEAVATNYNIKYV